LCEVLKLVVFVVVIVVIAVIDVVGCCWLLFVVVFLMNLALTRCPFTVVVGPVARPKHRNPIVHMARYMEISMYLAICFIARYTEISMFLGMCFIARNMEISMYLELTFL